jgi:hypothetical protein
MVYVDDEHVKSISGSTLDLRQYYVPNAHQADEEDAHLPVPAVQRHPSNPACHVPSHDLTRCGRITQGKTCAHTSGCAWDAEFNSCHAEESLFHIVVRCGVLVPISYAICYVLANRTQIQSMWAQHPSLHIAYNCSVVFATCSIMYLVSNVYYLRKYRSTRHRYANPLLTLFVGAGALPLFRLLWIQWGYSINWVLVCLFVTCVGLVWFMALYLRTINATKDRIGAASMYYALFHVILLDMFVWWWLLFSDSSKG